MKKIIPIAVLLAVIIGGVLVAQQNNAHAFRESEYHYFTVNIERIYAHRLGFVVLYRRGPHQMARTFIPEYWFAEPGGRGQLLRIGHGTTWPSMTVFTRNGEFSHVRLRVRRSRAHETWGVVPSHVNIDEYFQGIEEIRLQF